MINARNLMLLVAVILFVLAAVGVPALGGILLVPLGLAFWCGAALVA